MLLVPRYILPACEYEGFPHMHCSDTAQAEYLVGLALMAIGCAAFFFSQNKFLAPGALLSIILYGISYWLPSKIGYCQSPRMPCNYGMVPGIRFIAVISSLLMIVALTGIVKSYRSKGKA